MCGIAGILSPRTAPENVRERLARMLPGIARRGPDGSGTFVAPGVGLLHTRLAIIDLQTGDQPIWNETRTVACIFNGEIYNYRNLKEELVARGHVFVTQSDTEVLVHAYEEYGNDLTAHIHGMYAFAIYDRANGRVLLARDRLGIKPLFVATVPGGFAFASSLDSLLAVGADADPDPTAVVQYLQYRKVPEPRTIYRGVRALLPGHRASISVESPSLDPVQFHAFRSVGTGGTPDEARRCFERAVASHLVADVEVAAFLSGGIDSSLVVAQAQRLSSRKLRTFCVGFKGAKAYDETEFAARVARGIGTEHETVIVSAPPTDWIREALAAAQQPFAVASFLPLLKLCQSASERVKVVLTGDGGDEVGFGYPWYRWMRHATRWPSVLRSNRGARWLRRAEVSTGGHRIVRRLTKFTRGLLLDFPNTSDAWRTELTAGEALRLLRADLRPDTIPASAAAGAWRADLEPALALRMADLETSLRDEMLPKVDRAGMAFGLEGRVPLLDDDFVDAMVAIPAAAHMSDAKGKALLRQWAHELVPGIDLEREKHGFDVPIGDWLLTSLHDDVRRLLLDPSRKGLLAKTQVATAWRRAEQNVPGAAHDIYAMLMLELWYESRC